MSRNILFITTDQQRYDSLGCNGGAIARTPVADRLAAEGINYRRAYNQNTVCMPARSTMLTGRYARSHGVVANGVPLPVDAPSVAAYLSETAGYKTALLGKAHFEPAFDLRGRWEENARPGPGGHRSLAGLRPLDPGDARRGVQRAPDLPLRAVGPGLPPRGARAYANILGAEPGGDTGAPETKNNAIPRPWYHTDWVADRVVDWLDTVDRDDNWFCWMSFPDPHHPWDPPASELGRVPWRDLDLPPATRAPPTPSGRCWRASRPTGWPGTRAPGPTPRGARWTSTRRASPTTCCGRSTAKTHVMNELVDEACGRVLAHSGRGAGRRRPTSSTPPTTGSCSGTSGSSTRDRSTPTP